jgi:hypothetical protein
VWPHDVESFKGSTFCLFVMVQPWNIGVCWIDQVFVLRSLRVLVRFVFDRSFDFCVVFADSCLSFCPISFGQCIFCRFCDLRIMITSLVLWATPERLAVSIMSVHLIDGRWSVCTVVVSCRPFYLVNEIYLTLTISLTTPVDSTHGTETVSPSEAPRFAIWEANKNRSNTK